MIFRSVSIFALACAFVAPASAAETADATGEDQTQWITVTGQREEYGVKSTRTGTRTDTEIKDIPQALSVISESQVEDQALRSVADVLLYVPGATPGTGEGNRDQITLRGNNTTADFFVDGLRDDVQYFRDFYNVERVEILRGPNAMIFGRGGGGGVVNRVIKRSGLSPYREFAIAPDSEGGVRLTADLDQPLSANVGIRINGVYEQGESFRRGVKLDRYGVNPTIGLLIGPETRMDLSYEFFHDRRTADRGLPSFGDGPLKGADRTFFGDPKRSYADVDVNLATFAIEHQMGKGFSIRNRSIYGDYDKFYQNIFPGNLTEATGLVQLSAYNDTTTRQNLLSQTDFVWEGSLGGIEQTILFGFELGRQETFNRRLNGFFQRNFAGAPIDSGSILVPAGSPTIDADLIFRPVNTNAARTPASFNESEASIAAVYVQNQIRFSDFIELVAGLRYDRFELDVKNLNTGATFSRTDKLLSPRFGLIIKPTSRASLYASYSRSYLPSAGDQFTSLDITGEGLKPERFDNYEIGAKWEPVEGLLATAAVYQLDRTNTRAPGNAPGTIVLTGEQRSRGLELGLERSISDRWQISAGYALQEAEIRRTTSAAAAGKDVPLVPKHQFSVWSRYDLTGAFGIGLGIIARSESFASISNDVTLPGYTRVDGALFYEIGSGIEAQLNVENLFGADYFPTAHNDNNIAPGAPTTARAAVRFRF